MYNVFQSTITLIFNFAISVLPQTKGRGGGWETCKTARGSEVSLARSNKTHAPSTRCSSSSGSCVKWCTGWSTKLTVINAQPNWSVEYSIYHTLTSILHPLYLYHCILIYTEKNTKGALYRYRHETIKTSTYNYAIMQTGIIYICDVTSHAWPENIIRYVWRVHTCIWLCNVS